jgi:hypothetical protein
VIHSFVSVCLWSAFGMPGALRKVGLKCSQFGFDTLTLAVESAKVIIDHLVNCPFEVNSHTLEVLNLLTNLPFQIHQDFITTPLQHLCDPISLIERVSLGSRANR